jgi:hypothetical protein
MVGHEHPAMNFNAELICALCQPVCMGGKVSVTGEDSSPVVTPMDQMDWIAGRAKIGLALAPLPLCADKQDTILNHSAVILRPGFVHLGGEKMPRRIVRLLCSLHSDPIYSCWMSPMPNKPADWPGLLAELESI